MKDDNSDTTSFTGEEITTEVTTEFDSDEVSYSGSRVAGYEPGDIVCIEPGEDNPAWLVSQLEDMRGLADEMRDALDVYDRFIDEEWQETPSEVEGFLREKEYSGGDELEWLVEDTAEKAVELTRKRDKLSDVYNGTGLMPSGGRLSDIDQEETGKIRAELGYGSQTVHMIEHAGATTEGGQTPPYASVDVEPEHSLGLAYRRAVEEEAEQAGFVLPEGHDWGSSEEL